MLSKIAILGAGSWGTALAINLSLKNKNIFVWGREESQIRKIIDTQKNEKYLSNVIIPSGIKFTSNIYEAIKDAKIIIFAVSSQANRKILETIKNNISSDAILVNVSKGLEKETKLRASEIFAEIVPNNSFVALSGPSHAEEVSVFMPTTLVSSSNDENAMKYIQKIFSNESLRVYTNKDIVGVELGGALKNIIALGIGIIDGLGFGDNTKAAMMTRGMTEIVRFGVAMGADENTFFGLTGIGDLIVTCTSVHSRNRKAGILIANGKRIDELEKDINMVVEGIISTKIIKNIADSFGVEMPIVNSLYEVLYENKEPKEAIKELMIRESKSEYEDVLNLKG